MLINFNQKELKNMKNYSFLLLALCYIISLHCLILSGCGKKLPANWPKTYPCTIKVTKNGMALGNAMVILSPTNSAGNNWAVSGITNVNGVAVIHTSFINYTEAGAPEGTFIVTISKQLPPIPDPTPQEELEKMDYWERQAHIAKLDAEANKRPPIVPIKYSDVKQTTLKIEVKTNTTNEATFEIE
jgi:hypothetical protein